MEKIFEPDPLGEPDMDAQGRKELRANFGLAMTRMISWEAALKRESEIREQAAQRIAAFKDQLIGG